MHTRGGITFATCVRVSEGVKGECSQYIVFHLLQTPLFSESFSFSHSLSPTHSRRGRERVSLADVVLCGKVYAYRERETHT